MDGTVIFICIGLGLLTYSAHTAIELICSMRRVDYYSVTGRNCIKEECKALALQVAKEAPLDTNPDNAEDLLSMRNLFRIKKPINQTVYNKTYEKYKNILYDSSLNSPSIDFVNFAKTKNPNPKASEIKYLVREYIKRAEAFR